MRREAPWSPWITLKCRHLRNLGWPGGPEIEPAGSLPCLIYLWCCSSDFSTVFGASCALFGNLGKLWKVLFPGFSDFSWARLLGIC